ncbi:MAG: HAD family hydrolase [Coriobacteriia bacterium]|nr:HAD family hydrolase [Coriobacteriia bacterium]
MIDTILLDLDGTLLHYTQDEFVTVYFGKIQKVFARLGLDPQRATEAIWDGTKAMILNDGSELNSERFWEEFAHVMGGGLPDEQLARIEAACEAFYSGEFDTVRSILKNTDLTLPRQMIDELASRGFDVILATNPLFPSCAITTRLDWIGLAPEDFSLITDYANSRYCKPNPDYYREILAKVGKAPDQCLMVGNNTYEDMVAGTLSMGTYLVTDFLENETGRNISDFQHGTLEEAAGYLAQLPPVAAV